MRLETLGLEHKDLLTARFKALRLDFPEYTFAHTYLNRNINKCQVLFADDIYLKRVSFDNFPYLTLTAHPQKMDLKNLPALMHDVDFLYPIPKEWVAEFDSNLFAVEIKDRDTDYLYDLTKMQTFSGRKLASRRNLVKQFNENYSATTVPLTKERQKDAQFVLQKWTDNSGLERDDNDYYSCLEAIEKFDVLGLSGVIYYVNEIPAGLIIGEPLHTAFALHFAKADVQYKGIYAYMYQKFAQSLDTCFKFLDFEDDLGSPSLKRAKRAYDPDLLLQKVRLHLKKAEG